MQVDFAFLADAATSQPDGKISALGIGFADIGTTELPATYGPMSLVVRLNVHHTECDRDHTLEIQGVDADGNQVFGTLSMPFRKERFAADPTREQYVTLILNLPSITFPRKGDYAFNIVVDGNHQRGVSVRLWMIDELRAAMNPPQGD